MKIDKQRSANLQKAFNSIVIGTLSGLGTYYFFLYFNIAIFGWNLGLFFAPLVAGYVETYVAKKLIGEGIGAISAFILFLVTVVYGFIISNPTLGYNIITLGSIIIIIQAAIPTFANYFIIVVFIGTLSYLTGFFKKLLDSVEYNFRKFIKKEENIEYIGTPVLFDEKLSNERINSMNFIFMTSNNPQDLVYENIGYFHTTVIMKRHGLLNLSSDEFKNESLNRIKMGKDDCLEELANDIKSAGGNGVIDLEINYFLNGIGGSDFEVVAHGIGVKIMV